MSGSMSMMPQMAPQQGGGGMSLPQLLAMIHQSQGGQGGQGGGMPMPSGASPMSNYIGPQQGGAMTRPAMAPVAAPAQIGMGAGTAGLGGGLAGGTGGAAGSNQLMALLAQLKGGQTGVPPGQGGVPGNTPSALTQGAGGMWQGTPGQAPPPPPPPGPAGMPDFSTLRAAGAFQPPPGGVPGGMAGGMPQQMNPALMQWLHGMINGGQQPMQPPVAGNG